MAAANSHIDFIKKALSDQHVTETNDALNMKNFDGLTPYHLANDHEVQELLCEYRYSAYETIPVRIPISLVPFLTAMVVIAAITITFTVGQAACQSQMKKTIVELRYLFFYVTSPGALVKQNKTHILIFLCMAQFLV